MRDAFSDSLTAVATLAGLLLAIALGRAIHVSLRSRNLAHETAEIVRRATEVFVLMTSVVLGLMLDSAKRTFETNTRNIHGLATEIILLDRNMRTLSPDGDEVRRYLVDYVEAVLKEPDVLAPDAVAEAALDAAGKRLRTIAITNDQKLAVWNDGREIYRQVERDRWVALDAAGGTIPAPFMATLIVWLGAIFVGFSYRAPRNLVVTTTLLVAAVLLSSAVYLIVEMDRPSSGLIRISSAPFERTLQQLRR